MGNVYYVYVLFRPWDGSPCYVGKGKGRRWLVHEKSWNQKRNNHLANIIAKAGGELPKVKIRQGLTSAEACEIEIAFIKAIGREPNGPLVNMTDGGEGMLGLRRQMSTEHRAKISAANKGKKRSPEFCELMRMKSRGNRNAAGHRSAESRAFMTAIPKREVVTSRGELRRPNPPLTESQIEAMRPNLIAARKKRNPNYRHSNETKEKISKAQKRRPPPSIETRQKISASHIGNKNRLGGKKYIASISQ